MESLESQTTGRTDERDEKDGYFDLDDDSILADFKMPDLSVSDVFIFVSARYIYLVTHGRQRYRFNAINTVVLFEDMQQV